MATLLFHIHSLHDLLFLWQMRLLRTEDMDTPTAQTRARFPIDCQQVGVLEHVKATLTARQNLYENSINVPELSSSEQDRDSESEHESCSNPSTRKPFSFC